MIAALRPHLFPFLGLLILLTLTAIGSALPLGPGNLLLALGIGGIKMAIVAIYFMELRKGETLVRMASCVGLLWLTIYFMLILTDYLSRYPETLLQ